MSGSSESMKEAFPAKEDALSPEAERLREHFRHYLWDSSKTEAFAQAIVAELGITEEMVAAISNEYQLGPITHETVKNRRLKAADALATLLEVSQS